MMQAIETELWKTLIPENWETEDGGEDDEAALSLFDPEGAGTLEISCSEKEAGLVDEDDLEYFAEDLIQDDLEYRRIRCGNLSGLLFEYDDDKEPVHYKEWYLACDDLFFYVTWTRPLDEGQDEEDFVHEIMRSIVPLY